MTGMRTEGGDAEYYQNAKKNQEGGGRFSDAATRFEACSAKLRSQWMGPAEFEPEEKILVAGRYCVIFDQDKWFGVQVFGLKKGTDLPHSGK